MWTWGRLVWLCLMLGPACCLCLRVRQLFYNTIGVSATTKLRAWSPPLSLVSPLDGLSLGELEALATEGQPKSMGESLMDKLMKILMGGWLPEGKRTQMVAAATALGALFMAFVQWGSGDLALTELLKLVAEKWEVFALAFGAYFVAEKIDRKEDKKV